MKHYECLRIVPDCETQIIQNIKTSLFIPPLHNVLKYWGEVLRLSRDKSATSPKFSNCKTLHVRSIKYCMVDFDELNFSIKI